MAARDVDRLRARLRKVMGRKLGAEASSGAPGESPRRPRPLPDNLAIGTNPEGSFAESVECYELDFSHGGIPLRAVREIRGEDLAIQLRDASLHEMELTNAAYLDTETTSLTGGAGTLVFLVGIGYFEDDRFCLRQVFLRAPSEERAALRRVSELLVGRCGLVTFHGKSFDRHRIHERLRANAMRSPLLEMRHVDLCVLGRRLHRASLPRMRLQDLEREVLGLVRDDDLPGAGCPQAYFEFLQGTPGRIGDVFEHNRLDILSLVSLAARFGGPPDGSSGAPEHWVYGKGLLARGEGDRAMHHLRSAISHLRSRTLATPFAQAGARRMLQDVRRELSLLHRRRSEWVEAESLWKEAAEDHELWACIELSKHEEHRRKRFDEALAWTERALDVAERTREAGSILESLRRRRQRCRAKLALPT